MLIPVIQDFNDFSCFEGKLVVFSGCEVKQSTALLPLSRIAIKQSSNGMKRKKESLTDDLEGCLIG
jgi:hypothetical protein